MEHNRNSGSVAVGAIEARIPEFVAAIPDSLPPLAAAHRLPADQLDELAESWAVAPDSWERRGLGRLGRAAHRLRELRRAERRTLTCPACGVDELAEPPYLAFEGPPADGPVAPPYAIHFGDPSRQRCPSCGYGFGIDDDPDDGGVPVTFEAWGRSWTERGSPRFTEPTAI